MCDMTVDCQGIAVTVHSYMLWIQVHPYPAARHSAFKSMSATGKSDLEVGDKMGLGASESPPKWGMLC